MKQKHQNHLCQWGECDYGARSWKERRLLCESMFIPIERQTLILKMVERDVFLMKPKLQYHLSQRGECVSVPNHEKKRDYYVNLWLSQGKQNFN